MFRIFQLLVLIAIATFTVKPTFAFDNTNGPTLPAQCDSINVPEGNKLAFHAYARGAQVYKWNGTTSVWDFVGPVASLYAEENYFGEIGNHYTGPTWESKSGSLVEGRRVLGTGCAPDSSAIAWLLLSKYRTAGAGIFAQVTYIQRVNTTGGLIPSAPGAFNGEVREVPYTAEYYFYRAENPSSN